MYEDLILEERDKKFEIGDKSERDVLELVKFIRKDYDSNDEYLHAMEYCTGRLPTHNGKPGAPLYRGLIAPDFKVSNKITGKDGFFIEVKSFKKMYRLNDEPFGLEGYIIPIGQARQYLELSNKIRKPVHILTHDRSTNNVYKNSIDKMEFYKTTNDFGYGPENKLFYTQESAGECIGNTRDFFYK
jgi:hypothetical protein